MKFETLMVAMLLTGIIAPCASGNETDRMEEFDKLLIDTIGNATLALEFLRQGPTLAVHNLGTGNGYSVLEAVAAFAKVSGREIPYEVVERRDGDAATSFADPSKAADELGWQAEFDLERMCEDAWRWQQMHPYGYGDQKTEES